MIWIRWLAVIPVAILSCHAVFLLGMALLIGIGWLCPPEEMISGSCVAWWASYAERAAFVVCAGLAAFLVVVSAAVVAPSHRKQVAWASFAIGVMVTIYMSSPLSGIISVGAELITATIAGFAGVGLVARFHRHAVLPNKPLEPTR